jgi:hypothetical protein
MNISSELIQVTEYPNGIAISAYNQQMPSGGTALVAGDPATVGEYLVRYLFERGNGLPASTAHQRALKDAVVMSPGELDGLKQ